MARTLAHDDLELGMLVTISKVLPTPFNQLVRSSGQSSEFNQDQEITEDRRLNTALLNAIGYPLRVDSFDLPFLVGTVYNRVRAPQVGAPPRPSTRPTGSPICLDLRRVELMKISKEYAQWFVGACTDPIGELDANQSHHAGPAGDGIRKRV